MQKLKQEQKYLLDESKHHVVRKIYEVVKQYKDKYIVVDIDDSNHEYIADTASSCVLVPSNGDIVCGVAYDGSIYIESILKRQSIEPKKFKLQGEIEAGLDESKIHISPKEIAINSNNISLKSKLMGVTSDISNWFFNKLDMKSKFTKHEVEETYDISAKNKNEDIQNTIYTKSASTIQKSEEINVVTNKFNINT